MLFPFDGHDVNMMSGIHRDHTNPQIKTTDGGKVLNTKITTAAKISELRSLRALLPSYHA